jgi:hypothetical protein
MKYSERFVKALKSLPPNRAKAAIRAIEKFVDEPALPSLKFRQFKGLPEFFIINSVHGDRILLRRLPDGEFVAEDTGPHDNLYRRWDR